MFIREGDRIIHKPTRYVSEKHNTPETGKVVIVDCISPDVLIERMQRCYSPVFARFIAYNGGMNTLDDVIEVASMAGKEKPLIIKTSNAIEFGCNGKIYAKKGS